MAYYITEPLGGSDDVVVSVYKNTGESVDAFVIVAYAENVEQIKGLWPEAYMIECEEVNEITFTTRFPKPKWYNSSSNC